MKNLAKQDYNPGEIEKKWQARWEDEGLYKAIDFSQKPKKYFLIEFPYPSGERLHVGHGRSFTAIDALARKYRMMGFNVLYPFGWDAFGLPAENYALKTGINPRLSTTQNIANAKLQARRWGLSFDWSREVNTTDPKYYKWTQWIFLKLLEKDLAYQAEVSVNWCPSCRTNLADEEVLSDGRHERCGKKTEKRLQRQWLLKITAYADRLLEDLRLVDYPRKISQQQINWIGRKEWIDIKYPIEGTNKTLVVSTTRPETNFGATFIVVAPEHPLVKKIPNSNVKEYIKMAESKSELERLSEGRKKTGIFTGLYCLNQFNNKRLPIWVTDFVLMGIGTGAVVGVPGHDFRDFEFAQQFKLPVIRVVAGKDGDTSPINRKEQVQEGEGIMCNSEFLNGLDTHEATCRMMDYLEKKGWGKRTIRYHLRDWVFSRQHYWGEPIPVVYCAHCAKTPGISNLKFQISNIKGIDYAVIPVPEDQLPVELPYLENYQPPGTGESPLAGAEEWVETVCSRCGGPARRETDTMPNWAGSNWYFLRYCDPQNDKVIAAEEKLKYWLPVDLYNGGMEHTTLHLLYSRFIYKFLYDLGVAPVPEPYAKRRSHGVVLGSDGAKMSKSRGNVVNPDTVVALYGADSFRLYESFMGPFDQTIAWSEEGVQGCFRFLKRVWILANSLQSTDYSLGSCSRKAVVNKQLIRKLHQTIKKVGEDIDKMKFNTAVAAMMEFINSWQDSKAGLSKEDIGKFLQILAPFAPYITEELWQRLGDAKMQRKISPSLNLCLSESFQSIHLQPWPKYDPELLEEDRITVVIQVNGKVRDRLEVTPEEAEEEKKILELALASPKIQRYLHPKFDIPRVLTALKTVFIPGRLLNLVI